MSNVYDILKERGFVKQVTDETAFKETAGKDQLTIYVGFDPTADSLHVGSLVGLMAMAHMQRNGHKVIAIIGDGTAMIGDPSGKTEMRKMLTHEQILANGEKMKAQIGHYITFDEKVGFAVYNGDWLMNLKYIEILRDVGRYFSVNRMLTAESYKIRLETGLSFIEFNYQILQAFDFLKLYQNYGCTVQMGGDDQWGNIIAGADLIRRVENVRAEGVTWPLLTTASGQKMGKTADGAVWLDASKTSPYEFYQYWINCDDADVKRFLAYFTFLPMDEVEKLAQIAGADIRKTKEVLAFEVTKISHGEEEAAKARAASQAAFGGSGQDLSAIPTSKIEMSRLSTGILAIDLFAEVGLVASKSEARRLIKQGGAYVNKDKVENLEVMVRDSAIEDSAIVLRAGKKRYHRILVG